VEAGAASKAPYPDSNQARDPAVLSRGQPGSAPFSYAGYYFCNQEFIFHFTPGGRTPLDRRAIGVRYPDASNVARWAGAAGNRRCRGNTWFIPYETIQSRDKDRPHPATFPPRVPEYCVRLHGLSRTRVLMDPFLGLGSSALAAAELGIDFIGVEIDRHYLQEAVARTRSLIADR